MLPEYRRKLSYIQDKNFLGILFRYNRLMVNSRLEKYKYFSNIPTPPILLKIKRVIKSQAVCTSNVVCHQYFLFIICSNAYTLLMTILVTAYSRYSHTHNIQKYIHSNFTYCHTSLCHLSYEATIN